MKGDDPVRDLLARALAWHDAHVSFDQVVANVPPDLRGQAPANLPYSLWQLLEHLRITQWDILDFCRNAKYEGIKWPDDYWPPTTTPPTATAWDESVRRFKADRQALHDMAKDLTLDLHGKIPHGNGQTYLRELVLVIDHSAYHVGQLVLVRRLLGIWP